MANLQKFVKKLPSRDELANQLSKLDDKRYSSKLKMSDSKYSEVRTHLRTKAMNTGYSYRHIDRQSEPVYKSANIDNATEIAEYPEFSPLLGIELEIERSGSESLTSFENLKKMIKEHMPNMMLITSDGSLNNGFELIFKPTSYADLKNNAIQLGKFLKVLAKAGFRSHDIDTCGLHIHVSRNALDQTQINAINRIVTEPTLRNFWMAYSRRKANQLRWCQFTKQTSGRYHALNHKQSSKKTIEFRMFRGTLQPTTFLAAIELVNMMVTLAKLGNLTARTFCQGIKQSRAIMAYMRIQEITPPEAAKRIRKVYTDAERLELQRQRDYKKAIANQKAYQLWQSVRCGLGSEHALARAMRREPISILPVKVVNRQRDFKSALFTPIFYSPTGLKMANFPPEITAHTCTIAGRYNLRGYVSSARRLT